MPDEERRFFMWMWAVIIVLAILVGAFTLRWVVSVVLPG